MAERRWSERFVGGMAALALMLVAPGCGSTVRQASHDPASQVADAWVATEPGGMTAPPAPSASPRDVGTASTGAPASAGASTTSSSAGASGPSAPSGPSAAGSTAPAPDTGAAAAGPLPAGPAPAAVAPRVTGRTHGVSDDRILIGVPYLSRDRSELLETAGIGVPGDTRRQAQILIDDINSRGGVAGRLLEPVFVESAGTTSTSEQDQAACAAWTEDHDVFAVVAYVAGGRSGVILDCLQAKDTVIASNFVAGIVDRTMLEAYQEHFFPPSVVSLDRAAEAYVQGLEEAGYFEPGAVYGLIRIDQPQYGRVAEQVLFPALAARGVTLTEDIQYTGGGDNYQQQISSAVLRMRASGVTHVLFLNFELPLAFFTTAESQAWHPRYGLTSYQNPELSQTTVPATQLRRAVGVGWWPVYDVDAQRDPGDNPETQRCLDLMRSNGQDVSGRLTQLAALITCDAFFFFERVMTDIIDLDPSGFRAAAEALGTTYASPLTRHTRFAPDQHDGGATYRLLAFQDDCACFTYTSDYRPLPG